MMKVSKVIIAMLLAMVICAFGGVDAVNPGIQSGISTRAVQKLVNKVFPPVIEQIKRAHYPDIKHEKKKEKAYVYHPTFQALSVGSFITEVSGNRFTVGIRNFNLDLKAGWRVKKRKLRIWFSTHGNVQVRFAASKILASFNFGTQKVGASTRPTISVANVDVDVTTARVKLSRNIFAWFVNLITSFFKKKIRTMVNDIVRKGVHAGLTTAAAQMSAAITTTASLGALGSVNLSVTSPLQLVGNDIIALKFDGQITGKNGVVGQAARHNVPFVPTGRMLDVFIDTFVINSGADVVFKSNTFKPALLATSRRPAGYSYDMVGSTLGLPKLNEAGHADKLLRIRAVPSSALVVNSKVNALTATKNMDITIDLNLGNNNFLEICVIRATTSGSLNVSVGNANGLTILTPSLKGLSATFSQVRSNFGPITFNKLNGFLNQILNNLVVPAVNTMILQPIPIPKTKGLTLANPAIKFKDDSIYAGFDVDFVM